MKFHAPTNNFVIQHDDLKYASSLLRIAIKQIRLINGLPLSKYNQNSSLKPEDYAQKMIIDAANAIGIDMGAKWGNELDVSDID